MVRANEEEDFSNENFAPVADFRVEKLVMCMCLQLGSRPNNIVFDSTFCIKRLECLAYVSFPKHMYGEKEVRGHVMKLNKSLYGPNSAAQTWNRLLFNEFRKLKGENICASPRVCS